MAVISGVKVTDGGQGLARGVAGVRVSAEMVSVWEHLGGGAAEKSGEGRRGERAAHRRRKGRQGVAGWGFPCPVQLRRMRVCVCPLRL